MQFCVTPSCVMTTLAVADPSYVIVSLRDEDVADCPVICTVLDIERVMLPPVGYGNRFADVGTGITTSFTASLAVRFAVNAPCCDVPVVFSVLDDVLFTVRDVFPFARPVTV